MSITFPESDTRSNVDTFLKNGYDGRFGLGADIGRFLCFPLLRNPLKLLACLFADKIANKIDNCYYQ